MRGRALLSLLAALLGDFADAFQCFSTVAELLWKI